jgi:hypothetical protein
MTRGLAAWQGPLLGVAPPYAGPRGQAGGAPERESPVAVARKNTCCRTTCMQSGLALYSHWVSTGGAVCALPFRRCWEWRSNLPSPHKQCAWVQ